MKIILSSLFASVVAPNKQAKVAVRWFLHLQKVFPLLFQIFDNLYGQTITITETYVDTGRTVAPRATLFHA